MSQAVGQPAYDELPPLPYAGLGIRIVAAILDLMVLASVFLLFVSAAGLYLLTQTDWGQESDFTNSELVVAYAIVGSFILFVPVYWVGLWWWRGQSLGQMATRIVITDRDGYAVSGWRCLLRALLWPLSVIPLGLGLAPILFDQESRALHDMLSGTVVLELP